MGDLLINVLFIPLWPFGIVIPIIATIFLFHKRINLIKFIPIICTGIWSLVRVILIFPVSGERTPESYDFPLEQLLLIGTIGLILVVLFLSVASTWITYKILKKQNNMGLSGKVERNYEKKYAKSHNDLYLVRDGKMVARPIFTNELTTDRISLVLPTIEHEEQVKNYIDEHINNGELDLHGGALIEKMAYADWLKQLKNNSDEKTVNSEWVVSSTFFAVADGKIVGIIDIRHTLNQFLKDYGGHIGYGVRPSERRKGYATEILRLGLEYCKTIHLSSIMLACYKDNEASGKTILNNGGKLEREFEYIDGKTVQVYWITV